MEGIGFHGLVPQIATTSLSRGDTVTIKGKVDIVADKVIGMKQCEIVSMRRR